MTRALVTKLDLQRRIGGLDLDIYASQDVSPAVLAADTKQPGESDEQQLERLQAVERNAEIEQAIIFASAEVFACLDPRYRAIISPATWVIPDIVKTITISLALEIVSGYDTERKEQAALARKMLAALANGKMNLDTEVERSIVPGIPKLTYRWNPGTYQKTSNDGSAF